MLHFLQTELPSAAGRPDGSLVIICENAAAAAAQSTCR